MPNPIVMALVAAIGVAVGVVIGIIVGIFIRKSVAEKKIGSAEAEAKRLVDEAVKDAEAKKKEMIVEAKEDILKAKTEADRENKERRQELIRLENRTLAKEETLDRKIENYERKEEALNKKIKENTLIGEQIEQIKADQTKRLER